MRRGVGVRLSDEDRQALDRIAARRGIGAATVAREAIKQYIEATGGGDRWRRTAT